MLRIRDASPADETDWRRLWKSYNTFYETTVPDNVTTHTWHAVTDPDRLVIGRLAELEEKIIGFSLSVLHECTWTQNPVCYLEDLFVDPSARGTGAGRALIQDLADLAKQRNWSRLYWHTKRDNDVARKLYDSFVLADDFVRYRIAFK